MPAPEFSLTALAPVLIVDAVEPSVEFWTTRLGFTKENMVPGADGKLVFASVKRAVNGALMVKQRHETFYGTTEFYIREPGGNVVGFSARKE